MMTELSCSTIGQDLYCVRCGYNLRGLDWGSVCPECGCEIEKSRWPARLEPAWFGALSRGALLIGVAIAADGVGVLYARSDRSLIHPIATLVAAIGAWMFFSPHPLKSQRHTLITTLGRVVCVVAATFQLQAWLLFAADMLRIRVVPAPPVGGASGLLFFLNTMLLIWALKAALVFWRAAEIARRIGDRAGAIQASLLLILTSASLGLCAYAVATIRTPAGSQPILIAAFSLLSICAIWGLIFFSFFFVILRKCAGAAGVSAAADGTLP